MRPTWQDPSLVTVGEMSSTSIARCIDYTNPTHHRLEAFNSII